MKGYQYKPHDFVDIELDPNDPVLRRFAELAAGHGLDESTFRSLVDGMLPVIAAASSLDEVETAARSALAYYDLDGGIVDEITSSTREAFELTLAGEEVPEVYGRDRLQELDDWLAQAEADGRLSPQEVDALIDEGRAGFAGLERIEATRAAIEQGAPPPAPLFGQPGRTWTGNTSGSPSAPGAPVEADSPGSTQPKTQARTPEGMLDDPRYHQSGPEGDSYREQVEQAFQREYGTDPATRSI